ncbi:phosphatase PAP2 family protein [Polyangium aurulentum]|uniref:phosphatase PAP2 family protein n=1 Tax=Polyangium aurulentum TaxID=2567896 RepID=UPI00146BEB64|nr:phosphatase PAP2 family protein [Polyangium aurulentum]UQA62363.1 phosphatase PAP2 family protein [Polyangium aurulentum]
MSTSTHNGLWGPSDARASGESTESAPVPPSTLAPPLRTLLRTFALQDIMMLTYLVVVRLLLTRAASSAQQIGASRVTEVCIGVVLLAVVVGRLLPGVPAIVRKAVYGTGLVGVLLTNYLVLRDLLPVIRPDSVDAALLEIDIALFGAEPSLVLEALNVRPVVEWFSFFYFSYFFIGGTYMLFAVWLTRPSKHTTAFAIGTLMVFCIGQLGYMAVPGYGPHQFLASQFHGPVNGGFFWKCVWDTVQAGSAMKDIFPSLHTAVPTWFTLYAWNCSKDDPRWKWPARITGFFAANIIFSTVFLRWHYAIDVVAGLTLAITAGVVAPRLARLEQAWRERHGFRGAWIFS